MLATVGGMPGKMLNDAPERGPDGSSIGGFYTMIGSLGLGVLIGWAIDRHYGTSPWWTLGASCFFLVVGFYHLIRASGR